ncbi:MAG: flagellar biosynthesis anti-sigma factor FlgM [Armatimonadota bacterium]
MRIWSTEIPNIHLYKTLATGKTQVAPSFGSDRLTISKLASEVQGVKQHIAEIPNVREEKVQALKESIADGSYMVSGRELAGAMIEGAGRNGCPI